MCNLLVSRNMLIHQQETPMSMKSPAFSLDYFPSAQVACSIYQPAISIPPTSRQPHSPVGEYGSAGSSNGQCGSDPTTPYSTGTTPPLYYKSGRSSAERGQDPTHSLSTSPNFQPPRRSTSSLTSAFAASLARPFSNTTSSSPPSGLVAGKRRMGATENAAGVTWGTNTIFGQTTREMPAIYDAAYSESASEDEGSPPKGQGSIRVVMKNQNLFDGEGAASVPLLDPKHSARYQAYRESYANMLNIWGLTTARLEVLKFNGMRSRFQDSQDEETLISLGKRRAAVAAAVVWEGLDVGERCTRCGDYVLRKDKSSSKNLCRGCAQRRTVMACSLCKELVSGTYAPCLACGHAVHSLCHREWFGESGRECPTGCGCPCLKASLDRPFIVLEEKATVRLDETRLATVAERPESAAGLDGWEGVGATGLGRGLSANTTTMDWTRKVGDHEGGKTGARKAFAHRSQSTIWGEATKRQSQQRRRSREDTL